MEARIVRAAPALVLLLLLASCKGYGLGALDTEEASTFPGTGHLDTETPEEKKSREWWDSFYGKKSGEQSSDCSFYGTCSEQKKGWW